MDDFIQERHKPFAPLDRPRELIVACPPLRSNVNLSRIVRAASCFGVQRMVCSGNAKVLSKIARDTGDSIHLEIHRTLPPVLERLRQDGYQLVGLEQTTGSVSLPEFAFPRRSVLVVGNERLGLVEELLRLVDHTVEIPVWGLPYSHNVATATAVALYEYCRQHPRG